MVYLLNTNLKNNKKIVTALRNISGIGKTLSQQICDKLGLSHELRIKQLTMSQIEKLKFLISQSYLIGSDLKQYNRKNIQRLVKIASYRGFRHNEGLPTRGQRTHGNARTARKLKVVLYSKKSKKK